MRGYVNGAPSAVPPRRGGWRGRRVRLSNPPAPAPPALYEQAVDRVVGRLKGAEGVVAVYQIGHVGAPGISDIDLLAVFEDGATCEVDPLADLPERERRLFTHAVFGTSVGAFRDVQRYTLYHNYRLLWGQPHGEGGVGPQGLLLDELRRQIALEFLLACYISRTIEAVYGVVSVRGLLLSVNALRYDLEFLRITSGELHALVHQLVAWRGRWFERPVGGGELAGWFEAFYPALHAALAALLAERRLLLPPWASEVYARNVRLRRADALGYNHTGVVFPPALTALGKRAFRALHRMNRFVFGVPCVWENSSVLAQGSQAPELLPFMEERFRAFERMNRYNRVHLRHFAPLSGSLSRLFVGAAEGHTQPPSAAVPDSGTPSARAPRPRAEQGHTER